MWLRERVGRERVGRERVWVSDLTVDERWKEGLE